MDMWKFFGLTHIDHTVMNPMSLQKTSELIDVLNLKKGELALDIACGKAEFLCNVVEQYRVKGIGIDASPYTYAEAVKNVRARGFTKDIELHNMDGTAFEAKTLYHMSSCVGGSWIFQGHRGTLAALSKMTKPAGLVLVGEPFWRKEPHNDYLKMTGIEREQHGTHMGNVATGDELGLSFLYTVVSTEDDWDRYEGLQWQAAERFALANPDDADKDELLQKVRQNRKAYLKWGRDCLGWAMYLFQK